MSTKLLFPLLLFLALSTTTVLPRAAASPAEKKLVNAIEGLVYCQKCKHVGSWNLDGARPLPRAKVSITCKDNKNRVVLYRDATADNNGYFYAPLEGGRCEVSDPIKACVVRLLASPDAACNRLTNVNYGIQGARPRCENKTFTGEYTKTVVYTAGPLAFKPAYCHPRPRY